MYKETMNLTQKSFPKLIKKIQKKRRMNLMQLSSEMGLHERTLGQWLYRGVPHGVIEFFNYMKKGDKN